MKIARYLSVTVLLAGLLAPKLVFADDAAILERLAALEQEVKVLKRQLEVKKEDEDKKKAETPVITANAKDGFSIKSPDDSFKLKVTGYAQADGRFYLDNKKDIGTTDTFLARTVRTTFQGTVYKDYDFYISPEFAGSSVNLPDAYLDVHYWPELKLRAGKFKEPVGLERLQSTPNVEFAELGLPSNLVPNRDVGVQVFGDLFGDTVNYAVGIFNGVEDLGTSIQEGNNDKDVAARIFVTPFKNGDQEALRGLSAGVAGTYGHREGSTNSIPVYRSPGQVNVFTYNSNVTADGPIGRVAPQATYYYGPLGLLGEYVVSNEELVRTAAGSLLRERFNNEAWQLEATYVLTGEDASYKGVTPRHAFSLSDHTWGAFEIAARYGELDIDDDAFLLGFANPSASITKERAGAIGLNWYLNKNFKFVLDYERTLFSGGGPLVGGIAEDREAEDVVFGRFQIVY